MSGQPLDMPPAAAFALLERILGRNNLISATFLDHGARAARAVGRVVIRTAGRRTAGYGTGFLVSPRVLLTNNHVLSNPRAAAWSLVEFNYQDDSDGRAVRPVACALDPELFFATDRALDFTLVGVRRTDGGELREFGWSPLRADPGEVLVGEFVNIIQHPGGEPKQLALRENKVIGFPDERFLHYETDTAPGSSGSPVFNDQWEVVGLHHSGVPKRDSAGRILARDGSVWRSESGEHQIDWIANEGVRVAAILADLRSRPLNSGQREVRRQLLDGEPPHEDWRPNPQGLQPAAAGAVLAVPGAVQTGGAGPVVTPDGRAVWTIPLLISVELGGGAGLPPAEPGPPPPAPGGRDRRGEGPDAGGPSPGDDDLGRALDDLDRGESRPYYDADADRAERQQYYAALPEGLSPADKFDRLHELLEATHARTPPYKPRLHVYPWVDLQPNRMLRSIYSGQEFDPVELIQADFEIEQERLSRLSEFATREADVSPEALRAQEDLLEAALPFNCEHVVPQSWFNKREPMRGDLHHLFACESRCNSFRGNTPYFDFVDFGEAVRSECGKREGNRFEPEAGKGAAARATLYFLLRYPGLIDATSSEYTAERLDTLLAWHRQFGVTDYERHRNAAVFEKQGNRNPLIDFPAWGNDIDFKRGLG